MTATRWVGLGVALVFLNVSLTFTNIWPTLGIRLSRDLSIEMAMVVLGLVLAWRWAVARSSVTARWLAVVWVVLVLGRYADVTARSLYGRDVNLFWDLQHMPNVGAMFAAVADPWLRIGVVTGFIVIPLLIFGGARWAFGGVIHAIGDRRVRQVVGIGAGAVLAVAIAESVGADARGAVRFSEPVSQAYVRELGELAYEMTGAGVRRLAPAPVLRSDLSRIEGADVLLLFMESYGVVSWDRPEFAAGLADSRSRLASDIHETGRAVVSARVESTTFGGESWLAHISLLSGTEVRDPGTNKRLMAQNRDTLVKVFDRHGYRTVAVMPGLQRSWPQGAFYGFDHIYDLAQLDYQGPPFGWWDLNDQFALARLDQLEVAKRSRPPVFVLFPTITTHAPFVPTPPYQPDWDRILTSAPYDPEELDSAWSDYPDWLDLGPSYIKALRYAYRMVGGYLRHRADRDLLVILVGDHQPPALVSGEGAVWDVPVHVVASRRPVLDQLRRQGFADGLMPPSRVLARMDTLLPILLEAFGGEAVSDTSDRSWEPR